MLRNKKRTWADAVWAIGLFLWLVYQLVSHTCEVPDAVAYPWMIASCICMIIGIARCGYKLGKVFQRLGCKYNGCDMGKDR